MLRRIRKNLAIHRVYRDLVDEGVSYELDINGDLYRDDYVKLREIDIKNDKLRLSYIPKQLSREISNQERRMIRKKARLLGLTLTDNRNGTMSIE